MEKRLQTGDRGRETRGENLRQGKEEGWDDRDVRHQTGDKEQRPEIGDVGVRT